MAYSMLIPALGKKYSLELESYMWVPIHLASCVLIHTTIFLVFYLIKPVPVPLQILCPSEA